MGELRINSASDPIENSKLPKDKQDNNVEPKRLLDAVHNSAESLASLDDWNQERCSPNSSVSVLIEDGAVQIAADQQPRKKSKFCICVHKTFGNFILPGLFGVTRFRYVERLSPTCIITKELLSNITYYSSKLKIFFGVDILPDIQFMATLLYFPTGQIEADGLSAISAEIWAACYLLLNVHKEIREADFYDIRSAFTSLVWESAQTYRQTLKFFQTLQLFKQKIVPLWLEIEAIVGVTTVSEYIDQDNSPPVPTGKCVKCKKRERTLSVVQVKDNMTLENRLSLQITPEKHSKELKQSLEQKAFNDLDYGGKIEVIKGILKSPEQILQSGLAVFFRTEPKLIMENIVLNTFDEGCDIKDEELVEKGLTCSKAMKILHATLQMFYEEVSMTDTMLFDVTQVISNLSNDIYATLEYSDWICNKFSEFHSMLRLCYNFALMCFDLDLPSFDSVVRMEKQAQKTPSKMNATGSSKGLQNNNINTNVASVASLDAGDNMEAKVMSLTDLMLQASNTIVNHGKHPVIDDDFDWQNFYKTEYPGILQKLPIRIGNNLLQFSADVETSLVVRQRGIIPALHNDPVEIQTDMDQLKVKKHSALQYA